MVIFTTSNSIKIELVLFSTGHSQIRSQVAKMVQSRLNSLKDSGGSLIWK